MSVLLSNFYVHYREEVRTASIVACEPGVEVLTLDRELVNIFCILIILLIILLFFLNKNVSCAKIKLFKNFFILAGSEITLFHDFTHKRESSNCLKNVYYIFSVPSKS